MLLYFPVHHTPDGFVDTQRIEATSNTLWLFHLNSASALTEFHPIDKPRNFRLCWASLLVAERIAHLLMLFAVHRGYEATLVANQEEANYLPNYHASSDTFDKVDIRELKLHAALAAVTAFGIAENSERLGKRQSRAEIEELLKRTGLVEKMTQLGYWEPWQNGTRGRQKD